MKLLEEINETLFVLFVGLIGILYCCLLFGLYCGKNGTLLLVGGYVLIILISLCPTIAFDILMGESQ